MFRSNKRVFDAAPTKSSTVKCALRNRCLNQQVYEVIQDDVTLMSSLAVEASRYIHFRLMEDYKNETFPAIKYKFKQYFMDLITSERKPVPKVSEQLEYMAIRGWKPFYYINTRHYNIINYLAQKFETAFWVNLKTHAYTRLKRYFKSIVKEDGVPYTPLEIGNSLDYLFDERPGRKKLHPGLRKKLLDLGWNGGRLHNITDRNYFRHVKMFYKLQRYNEDNRLKNFKLIPQTHFGAVHIRYDQQSMFYLVDGFNVYKREKDDVNKNQNDARDDISGNEKKRKRMWRQFFKLPETRNKKFDFTLETDGVAVSFVMKSKVNNPDSDNEAFLAKVRHKLENDEYDARKGLDPGAKLMVGGISYEKDENGDWLPPNRIKISSKEYHNRSGFTTRKHLLDKWTTPEQTEVSSMSEHYTAYVSYQMRIFNRKQREFRKRKVVRLKLKKYICVSRTCAKIAREIVGESKNVLVAVGSSEIAANSPIKGYRRVPNRQLVKALKEIADVFKEDEFRTTMLCAKCHGINRTSRSPHRYQFCPNCRTNWHRDVNAGINILYRAECRLLGIPLDPNFIRGNIAI